MSLWSMYILARRLLLLESGHQARNKGRGNNQADQGRQESEAGQAHPLSFHSDGQGAFGSDQALEALPYSTSTAAGQSSSHTSKTSIPYKTLP